MVAALLLRIIVGADGNKVVFHSGDIFAKDLITSEVIRVNTDSRGGQANDN